MCDKMNIFFFRKMWNDGKNKEKKEKQTKFFFFIFNLSVESDQDFSSILSQYEYYIRNNLKQQNISAT